MDDLERRNPTQGRFVVYAAKGSHASYPNEQSSSNPVSTADETKKGGVEWETWCLLLALPDQPWAKFAGAWGEVGAFDVTTGPLGPLHKANEM